MDSSLEWAPLFREEKVHLAHLEATPFQQPLPSSEWVLPADHPELCYRVVGRSMDEKALVHYQQEKEKQYRKESKAIAARHLLEQLCI